MTRRLTPLFLALALLATPLMAQQSYQLVWSDEFDGTAVDTTKWEFMTGTGTNFGLQPGWGNNELEYYRAENATIDNGQLVITAKQESFRGSQYTSARLRSVNKFEFLYGRVEARLKLPKGQGMWPAFWMLPTASPYGGWAASGEIDIMEAVNQVDYVHGTIHYGDAWPDNAYSGNGYTDATADFSADFHDYVFEWQPDEMRWYVDGNLFGIINDWFSVNGPYPAPFDVPFHFLVNLAVGGNWPGAPDATTVFPQEYRVDYIRVYQVSNTAPTATITSPGNGATIPAGALTVSVNASDSDGTVDRVDLFANGTLVATDNAAPFELGWNAPDGCHLLKAVAWDNVGWTGRDEITVTAGAGCPQLPFYGTPLAIPGIVEAEDFDEGIQGEAYNDATPLENSGGAYRNTGVDMEAAIENGYNVGWTEPGEWIEYTVDVATAGTYDLNVRHASSGNTGSIHVEMDGVDVSGAISLPNTSGWQNWATASTSVNLSAGEQVMRVVIDTGGININYFELVDPGSGGGDCGNGVCDAGEDCNSCSSDCAGVTGGKPSGKYCCGNGVQEGPEGDGSVCDGNF